MIVEIIKHSAKNWTALYYENNTPAWLMCYLFVKYPAIQKLEMKDGYLTRDHVKTQIKDTKRSLAAANNGTEIVIDNMRNLFTIEDIKKAPVTLKTIDY